MQSPLKKHFMMKTIHNSGSGENEFSRLTNEEKIMQRTAEYAPPFTTSKEEARQKLQNKIDALAMQQRAKQRTLAPWSRYTLAVAAAIALLVVATWFWSNRSITTEILTAKSEHIDYTLPDGSEVALNAASKLSFSKNKFNQERKLKLEGEAFFNVKKGKKFVIQTQLAEVKILGTSLNVFSRDSICRVSCVTGRVMVTKGNQSVIILPGESATIIHDNLKKITNVSIKKIGNWRYGEFYFENAALSNVFKEMELQFNTTFVLPNTEGKCFTGSFESKNLENALDIVCIPMGLTYDISSAKEVLISQKAN